MNIKYQDVSCTKSRWTLSVSG